MSATPAPQRIELSPAVRAILEADTPKSQLLRHFLSFTEAIIAPDPAGIDRVVSPDARFHDWKRLDTSADRKGLRCSGDRSMRLFPMNIFLLSMCVLRETTS